MENTEPKKKSPRRKLGMDAVEKRVRLGMLMDLYGGLLTDRQRRFIQLHYDEDLSFGEIAREHGVSRQAIHDAVKHGENALENYELKLHLMDKGVVPAKAPTQEVAEAVKAALPPQPSTDTSVDKVLLQDAINKLEEIESTIQKSGNIIYDASGLAKQIADVSKQLQTMNGDA